MKYKLIMSEKCDNCGLCTGNKYISDENGEKPVVKYSIISEKEKEGVQNIIGICPVGALSLSELKKITLESCHHKIDSMISKFSLEMPLENQFAYDKKYAVYSLPSSFDEEWKYNYNSSDEAKSAGCRFFERNVLSERTNCIRQILNNYSIDKLASYLDYKECPGNFYYDSIQKAEQVLKSVYEFILQAADDYPVIEDYITIDPKIVNDDKLRWSKETLDNISAKAHIICDRIRRNTGERFKTYIDVTYTYVEKKTLFGTQDKQKYAFYGLYQAAAEVEKDINKAVDDNFPKIVQAEVYSNIQRIVREFENILVEHMKKKTNLLIEDVQQFISNGSSEQSRYFDLHNTVAENSDYSGRFGDDIRAFCEKYSLKTDETISIINNVTDKEEMVLAKISGEDEHVRFGSIAYYDEYAIVEKNYYNLNLCDFIRVNLLTGKMEVMKKDVYMDGPMKIGYNDDTYAWWWYGHELFLWNSKEQKTKTVMTSYSYWCLCIGSNNKYAYIWNDDYYRYSYLTGEYEKISRDGWTSPVLVRNGELFYKTYYEPRKLCTENGGCICKPPYPAPENINANDDYIVWYQQGKSFYDRDIYICNRDNNQYKKVLTFSVENTCCSTIYFWIRESVIQVVWMVDPGWKKRKIIQKWVISFDGIIQSHVEEQLSKQKENVLSHFSEQSSLQKTLPDIFFD